MMRYQTFSLASPSRWALLSLVCTTACQLGSTPIYLNEESQSAAGPKSTGTVTVVGGGPSQRSSTLPTQTGGAKAIKGTAGAAAIEATGANTWPRTTVGPSTAGAGSMNSAGGAPMEPTRTATGGRGGGTTQGWAGNGMGFAGFAQMPELAAACSAPETGIVIDSTLEVMKQMLVGEWLACSISMCGSEVVGLELRADGTWFELTRDGNGKLAHVSGRSGGYGTWSLIDSGEARWPGRYRFTVGYGEATPSTTTVPVVLTPDGAKLMGGPNSCIATYVQASAVPQLASGRFTGKWIGDTPVESTPIPVVRPSSFTAACENPPTDVWSCSTAAELGTAVMGTWLKCYESCANCRFENGSELLPDGTFYYLYANADGQFYRGRGWGRRGRWRTVEPDSGAVYLETVLDGGYGVDREPMTLYGSTAPTYWDSRSVHSRSYLRVDE